MFVADVPPDVPPAFVRSICSEQTVSLNDIKSERLSVKRLVEIANSVSNDKSVKSEGLKLKMISKVGFEFGAQGGYYQRVKDIKVFLKKYEDKFDSIFNFQSLMMNNGRVVPPIIGSAVNTYNQEEPDSARMSQLNYNIVEQARFSPVAPNWRSYLYFASGAEPRVPNKAVLPKTDIEKDAWKRSIAAGWSSGVCQANKGYALNISKLRRDYLGMVRYHILLKRGIVSKPFVAQTEQKITGEASSIKIGDRLLRITVKPGFNLDSRKWDAVIQQDPFYKKTKSKEMFKMSGQDSLAEKVNVPIESAKNKILNVRDSKVISKQTSISTVPVKSKDAGNSVMFKGVSYGNGMVDNNTNSKPITVKVK